MIEAHPEIHTVDGRPFPKEWLKERQIADIHCVALTGRRKDERRQIYQQHKYNKLGLLVIILICNKIIMALVVKLSLQSMINSMGNDSRDL